MTIGRITVDLLAKTSSFETDLARASKAAEKRAKEIDAAISKAGTAVGAALGAAGVAALAFGKQLIDGLDALNDVKDATGASIKNISALEDVALRTGGSLDTVSSILVKFNGALKDADGKDGTSKILKEIGLSAEELKKLDPAEALRRVAVAFDGYADNGDRARYMQEIFGKSVKEAAAFMKDLAEQTSLNGKVTAEQAQAAEDFNKQLFALQKSAIDAGRAILSDLLPPINRLVEEMKQGIKTFGSFWNAAVEIGGKTSPFASWGDNAKTAADQVSKLSDEVAKLEARAKAPGLTQNAGGAAFVGPQGTGGAALGSRLAAARRELEEAKKRKEYFDRLIFDDAARKSDGLETFGLNNKPSVSGNATTNTPKAPKGPKAPKDSEFDKYLENLQRQLDKIKELSVAETVLADIAGGRLKLQKGESADALVAVAKQVDAAKALAEQTKLAAEFDQQLREAKLKGMEAQENQVQSLAEGNQAMRDEIALIGKNAEAQAAIEAARISSTIAIKEEKLARLANSEFMSREAIALEEEIRLLKERQDLVGMRGVAQKLADDAQEAKDFAKQVGAAFESSFEKAILEGGKLSDVLKGLAKDILGLTIRQSITGPLSSAIGGLLAGGLSGSLFGANAVGALGGDSLGAFISLAGLDKRAGGGPVSAGKPYIVGELGQELFVPNTAGKIIPNHALGGGQAVNVVINNTIGDVATVSQVREAQAGTERRIVSMIGRSQRYAGALA